MMMMMMTVRGHGWANTKEWGAELQDTHRERERELCRAKRAPKGMTVPVSAFTHCQPVQDKGSRK